MQHRLFLAFSAAIDATKWLAGKVGLRGRPRGFADAFDLLVQAGAPPTGKQRALDITPWYNMEANADRS